MSGVDIEDLSTQLREVYLNGTLLESFLNGELRDLPQQLNIMLTTCLF
jgi:hypothetical protein